MNLLPVLSASASGSGAMSIGIMILYVGGIMALFYFFLVRPQKKQEKAHQALLTTIRPGDSVLTSSGFYGVVIDVNDDVVIVEFGSNKNCRIPMKKDSILEVEKAEGTEE